MKYSRRCSPKLKKEIQSVISWVSYMGWTVDELPPEQKELGGLCVYATRTILLSQDETPKIFLYTLLHECGHLRLDDVRYAKVQRLTNPRFRSREKTEGFHAQSLTSRISILDRELDAWAEAEHLAGELGIKLTKYFYMHRAVCLATYIRKLFTDHS